MKIALPSPRKHEEFSFEEQVVKYWLNGFVVAELRIMTGMFYVYSDDMPEEEEEELFDAMLNFYKSL